MLKTLQNQKKCRKVIFAGKIKKPKGSIKKGGNNNVDRTPRIKNFNKIN